MNGLGMWIGIVAVVGIIAIAAFVFLINRLMRLDFIRKVSKDKKGLKIICSIILNIAVLALCTIWMSIYNAIIILIQLIIFWAIIDFCAFIIGKITKVKIDPQKTAALATAITIGFMGVSYYLANNVWQKNYSLTTNKEVGSIRIVHFADSHIGTTVSGVELLEYVEQMNACEPDVVLITGDFIDDNTSLQDMKDACASLSHLKTKYGVFFSFGNHDKGYGDILSRGYSPEDLIAEMEKNGVVVLQDEAVLVDDRFYVVGRQDKSEETRNNGTRSSAVDLMAELDSSKYVVFMDHQPNDYANEAESKCDLVLSGHTHGGQFLPFNEVGVWIGANDKTYGYERRENTDFIVTSGISDWEFVFKSGCKSEYVVVDIVNE